MTIRAQRPGGVDPQHPAKPEQLKLFMSGNEWKNQVTHSTDGPLDKVWPEKEAQARSNDPSVHGSGLYDSMSKSGYDPSEGDSPPTTVLEMSPNGKNLRRVQSDGHHRVAASAAIENDTGNPVYIPSNYVDITPSARRAMHRE